MEPFPSPWDDQNVLANNMQCPHTTILLVENRSRLLSIEHQPFCSCLSNGHERCPCENTVDSDQFDSMSISTLDQPYIVYPFSKLIHLRSFLGLWFVYRLSLCFWFVSVFVPVSVSFCRNLQVYLSEIWAWFDSDMTSHRSISHLPTKVTMVIIQRKTSNPLTRNTSNLGRMSSQPNSVLTSRQLETRGIAYQPEPPLVP